jgi:hypothetical protein
MKIKLLAIIKNHIKVNVSHSSIFFVIWSIIKSYRITEMSMASGRDLYNDLILFIIIFNKLNYIYIV